MQWFGLLLVFAGLLQLALDTVAETKSGRSSDGAARRLEPRVAGAR
jgi:hypothetical protein